jgi:hypothetical protein
VPDVLDERIRIQVELALADCRGCAETRAWQECLARTAGLSGAEIDAARSGRCFDMRANAAVVLACAARASPALPGVPLAAALAAQARRAGLSNAEIEAVQALAQSGRSVTGKEQLK